MVKTVLEDGDLFVVGTRDNRYDGGYKPTITPLNAVVQAVTSQLPPLPTGLFGLYSQTNTSIPITNTIVETSLLDGGVGTLSVPPNGFSVGNGFAVVATGHISSVNNHTLRIRIKTGSIVLADTGFITMSGSIDKHWSLNINFAIRAVGTSGTAAIATGGTFFYTKDASNAFEGTNFSTETTTGFDTTVSNTLSITAQWGTASTGDSISSEIFNLYKIY